MFISRRFLICVIGIVLLSSFSGSLYSQCSTVPVVESITNGNFEDGYVGFTIGDNASVYDKVNAELNQSSKPGTYQVGTNSMTKNGLPNASSFNSPSFDGVFDRDFETKGVKGNMLMIDALKPDDISWQTTVDVFPNQVYYFSAWIVELDKGREQNNAILQFEIVEEGGAVKSLGDPFKASNAWQQTFVTWNSGTNRVVTLRIRDSQINVDQGNDFALDDISFINGCNNIVADKPDLGETQTLCTEGNIELDAKTPGTAYHWSFVPPGGANGTELPDKTQKITATQAGTYQVCITNSQLPNCPITSSVEVLGTIEADLGDDLVLCNPPIATLDPKVKGSKLSYKWQKAPLETPAAFTDLAGSSGPTLVTPEPGIYKVTVSSSVPGCEPKEDIVKIESNNAIPLPGTFCRSTATFKVEGTGQYAWYKTETDKVKLGGGNSFTIPVDQLTKTTGEPATVVLYVADTGLSPRTSGAKVSELSGPQAQFAQGQQDRALIFDAEKEFILDEVTLPTKFYSKNDQPQQSSIQLLDPSGKVIASQKVIIENPGTGDNLVVEHKVKLMDFVIPKGTGYSLILKPDNATTGYQQINGGYLQNSTGYPYKVDEVLTIRQPRNDPNAQQTYGYFFDWKILVPPGCGRVPVVLTEDCPKCDPPETLTITTGGRATEHCAPISGLQDITLTAEATPLTPPTAGSDYIFEWYQDGVKIAEVGNSITVPFPTPFGNVTYEVRVGDKDISNEFCYSKFDTVIRVSEQLRPGTLKTDTTICEGVSLTSQSLTPATGGGPSRVYNWYKKTEESADWELIESESKNENIETGPISVPTSFKRVVTDPKCGTEETNEYVVSINKIREPVVTLADPFNSICELEAHSFKADSSGAGSKGTFIWEYRNISGTVEALATGPNVVIKAAETWGEGDKGIITVILRPGNDYACYGPEARAIDTFDIVHKEIPTVELLGENIICEGSEITFTANARPRSENGDNITFKINGEIVQEDPLNNIFVTSGLLNDQVISVEFTSASQCAIRPNADPDSKTMVVYEKPDPIISAGDTVCAGFTVPIIGNGQFSTTNLDTTFQWLNAGVPVSSATNSYYNASVEGDYSIVITNGVCPPDTSEISIVRIEDPRVDAGRDFNRMIDDPATEIEGSLLNIEKIYTSVTDPTWDFTPFDSSFTENTSDPYRPYVTPSVPTWYYITVKTALNCLAKDSMLVNVYLPIRVPNAFTPNSDGVNDRWSIAGLYSYPEADVKVFNRWGNIVFRSEGYMPHQEWDGKTNGNLVPVATYYYVIDPKVDVPGVGGPRTGWVVVFQ